MSIQFRCPECDHKLRAADNAAGRQSRCKCGALVTIPGASGEPQTEEDDTSTGSSWQLKPRFNAANGDLCEAITAWSPLCAKKPARMDSDRGDPTGYWQGILIGAAGVLVVSFMVIGVAYLFRHSPEQQTTQESNENVDRNASPPPIVNPPPKEPGQSTPVKEPGKPQGNDKAKDAKKPAKEPTPVAPPKKKEEPKPAPPALENIEIVDWYTAHKIDIIGDSGKQEVLERQDEAVKANWVFVAVKARMPAKMLEGKKFDVEKADTSLQTPSSNTPFAAFGCSINDRLWFAPVMGQHAHPAPKDGIVTQSWIFIVPLKDLQTGRTTFQLEGQPALTLTLETGKIES
jgi:hypothetical protein